MKQKPRLPDRDTVRQAGRFLWVRSSGSCLRAEDGAIHFVSLPPAIHPAWARKQGLDKPGIPGIL